jgi:hypothetical protein
VQIIRPLPNGNCCAIVKPLAAEDRNHLTTDEALLAASRACLARTPQVSMEVDEEEEELDFIDNMSMYGKYFFYFFTLGLFQDNKSKGNPKVAGQITVRIGMIKTNQRMDDIHTKSF